MSNMSMIFSDGSCSPNPGIGGWAVVQIVDDTIQYETGDANLQTTNNRMELCAFIEALKIAQSSNDVIHTDSQLVYNITTKWMSGWKKRGWKKSDGKTPENLDLVELLDQTYKQFHCVKWVKAHCNDDDPLHKWNNYVDKKANHYREQITNSSTNAS